MDRLLVVEGLRIRVDHDSAEEPPYVVFGYCGGERERDERFMLLLDEDCRLLEVHVKRDAGWQLAWCSDDEEF